MMRDSSSSRDDSASSIASTAAHTRPRLVLLPSPDERRRRRLDEKDVDELADEPDVSAALVDSLATATARATSDVRDVDGSERCCGSGLTTRSATGGRGLCVALVGKGGYGFEVEAKRGVTSDAESCTCCISGEGDGEADESAGRARVDEAGEGAGAGERRTNEPRYDMRRCADDGDLGGSLKSPAAPGVDSRGPEAVRSPRSSSSPAAELELDDGESSRATSFSGSLGFSGWKSSYRCRRAGLASAVGT